MPHDYEIQLFGEFGEWDSAKFPDVFPFGDDVALLYDYEPSPKAMLSIVNPSANFLTLPPYSDGNILLFTSYDTPFKGHRNSTKEIVEHVSRVAEHRLQSVVYSIFNEGLTVFFINKNNLTNGNWNFGAQPNPNNNYLRSNPIKKTDHPLLSIPWTDITSLSDIYFEGDYPKTIPLRQLLFPEGAAVPQPDPVVYAGLDRLLNRNVILTTAYENELCQALALLVTPADGKGAMLVINGPKSIELLFPHFPILFSLPERQTKTPPKQVPSATLSQDNYSHEYGGSSAAECDAYNEEKLSGLSFTDDPKTIEFLNKQPLNSLSKTAVKGRVQRSYATFSVARNRSSQNRTQIAEEASKRDYLEQIGETSYDDYRAEATAKLEFYRAYDQIRCNRPTEAIQTAITKALKDIKLKSKYMNHPTKWLLLRRHQRDFHAVFLNERSRFPNGTSDIDIIHSLVNGKPDQFFFDPHTYHDFLQVCPGEGIFPAT